MQDEALQMMDMLARGTRVELCYFTPRGWDGAKYEANQWCAANLSAPFRVMLTREDDISDDYAWLAIYCDPADVPKLVERWPRASVSEPRKRTEADIKPEDLKIPDWLLKFAESNTNENSNR